MCLRERDPLAELEHRGLGGFHGGRSHRGQDGGERLGQPGRALRAGASDRDEVPLERWREAVVKVFGQVVAVEGEPEADGLGVSGREREREELQSRC